jgi:hypothetical protein
MDSFPETGTSSDTTTASPRLISGGRALGAFLVLAAILTGIVLFTRSNQSATPPVTEDGRSGTFSLTNAEAITRFKQLDRLHSLAYERRDASLLAQVLTADSPMRDAAYRDIARLRRNRVLDKTKFHTRALQARLNTQREIVVRQVVIQRSLFLTEKGRDVSKLRAPILVTVDWTLHKEGSSWRIFNSSVLHARRLDSSN